MKLKLNLFFFLGLFCLSHAFCQELDSITMSMENGKVVVRYDFLDGEEDTDYEMYLYSSHDNFTSPLQLTTGDVGKHVRIGSSKVIYWDAQKELGVFKGDISLKIKGSIYEPFIEFQNISKDLKIKKGETYRFRWKKNDKTKKILLHIKRHGVPAIEPILMDNSGEFTWIVPKSTKTGKGYTIQIMDIENNLREETSKSFALKGKPTWAFIAVPAAVVAGVGIYFMTKPGETESGIPEPPTAPASN